MAVDGKSGLGGFCRETKQFRQRKFSVMSRGKIIGRQRTGHAGGQRTGQAQPWNDLPFVEEHVVGRGRRRGFTPVDCGERSVAQSDQQKTPPAKAGVMTIDHAEGQGGRHRGIDRIATFLKRVDGRIGGQRMHGGHDAARSMRHLASGLDQRTAEQSDAQRRANTRKKPTLHFVNGKAENFSRTLIPQRGLAATTQTRFSAMSCRRGAVLRRGEMGLARQAGTES